MVAVVAENRTQTAALRWPDDCQRVARLEEPGPDGFARSWIMLFPLGRFKHPEYGTLNFTRPRLSDIKRKFDLRVRHIDIALDADHKASKGDSRATGWIEAVELRETSGDTPGGLWGHIKWTPYGMQLLRDQEYRYFSPEFGDWDDPETGKTWSDVLMGGGLTNRPFLKQMPALTLSDKSWGSVNKSKLPRSSFLIQGDPDDKSTWRLPIYEGAGPVDSEGHYTKRGPLNINAVRAALAALGGARTGNPMTGVPSGTRERLQRLLAKQGGGGDAADTKAASEGGRETMAKKLERERDEGLVFMGASGAAPMAKAPLGPHTKDGDMRDESQLDDTDMMDDETLDDSETYDDDTLDDDSFSASSDTHGALTTDGHTHGKFAEHSHDGDADHSDAPLKSGKGMHEPQRQRAKRERTLTLAEARQMREEHQHLRFQLYERDVTERVRQLAEKLGTSAPSKVFADAYKSFMLEDGFGMDEALRAKINKLCDLALRRGAVDLRSLGSSYDAEARRTIKASEQQASKRGGSTDQELELVDLATRMALSEKVLEPGQQLTDISDTDKRARFLNRAAREVGYGA